MIVVTDTSVILNLCLIRHEAVLQSLFGSILAPEAVLAEFQRLVAVEQRFAGLAFPAFIETHSAVRLLPELIDSPRLQSGEIAALSLAVERGADAVLMDELSGRAAAVALGLKPVGLLGILLDAKDLGLIPAVAPLLDKLEAEARFWISASLRAVILKDAGEMTP